MPVKSNLSEFCEARGISDQIKTAFGAYLRSIYAQKFLMNENGETIHLVMGRMSQEDLADAWQDFVKDLARYLAQRPE
jgi:hypothetical protein